MTSSGVDLNALYTEVTNTRRMSTKTRDHTVIDSWRHLINLLLGAAFMLPDGPFEPSWDLRVDLSVAFHYDLEHTYSCQDAARLLFRLACLDYVRCLVELGEYNEALCALPLVKSLALPIRMGAYVLEKLTGNKVAVYPEDIPESFFLEYFGSHGRDAFLELWLDPLDQAVYGFIAAPTPGGARPYTVHCEKLLSGSESIAASAFARALTDDAAAFCTADYKPDLLVKWKAETNGRANIRDLMDKTEPGRRHKLEWPYDDPPVVFLDGYAESLDRETLDIPGREWVDSALSTFSERLIAFFDGTVPGMLRRLVISPHAFLHLVPIHGLPLDTSGADCEQGRASSLIDRCESIAYVPSLKVFQMLGHLPVSPKLSQSRLAGFADTEHLRFARAESLLMKAIWGDRKTSVVVNPLLSDMSAGKDTGIIHLACHARNVPDASQDSGIHLLDGILSNDDIQDGADLWGTGVVVLNACATGCSGLYSGVMDEYLGLDGAFMSRGAAQVVSTLWPVRDAVACLFAAHFYRMLLGNADAAGCTCDTQRWLREGLWKTDGILKADLEHAWLAACKETDSGARASLLMLGAFIETTPATGLSAYRDWAAWKCTSAYESP